MKLNDWWSGKGCLEVLLALIALLVFAVPMACAARFEIAQSDTNGLRAAIGFANDELAYPGPDTIVLTPGGPYLFTDTVSWLSALPVITSTILVEGNGAVIAREGAAEDFRLFTVSPGGELAIDALTLEGGAAEFGGAIYSVGDLTLTDCILRNNRASVGGGVYVSGGGLTSLSRVLVQGNQAEGRFGGGLYIHGSQVVVLETSFEGNVAAVGGGALFAEKAANVTVLRSTFFANHAEISGGAILVNDSRLRLEGATLSANRAGWFGGALSSVLSAKVTLVSCTLADNRSGYGGSGIYTGFAGKVRGAAILLSEDASVVPLCFGGGIEMDDASMVTDPGCGGMFIPYVEMALGPLADNGGVTRTHALMPGSRAIDSPFVVEASQVDQRGLSRTMDGDNDMVAYADVGAFEHETMLVIDVMPGDETNNLRLDRDHIDVLVLPTSLGFNYMNLLPADLIGAVIAFGEGQATPRVELVKKNVLDHHIAGTGLLLHFNTAETGLDAEDTLACLVVQLVDGRAFRGCERMNLP